MLLDPLPDTLSDWETEGRPLVFVEVRWEFDCWLVGTLELARVGDATERPVVRVREIVPFVPLGGEPGLSHIEAVDQAKRRAARARRRAIRPCASCGTPTPPELAGARGGGSRLCFACAAPSH